MLKLPGVVATVVVADARIITRFLTVNFKKCELTSCGGCHAGQKRGALSHRNNAESRTLEGLALVPIVVNNAKAAHEQVLADIRIGLGLRIRRSSGNAAGLLDWLLQNDGSDVVGRRKRRRNVGWEGVNILDSDLVLGEVLGLSERNLDARRLTFHNTDKLGNLRNGSAGLNMSLTYSHRERS